VENAELRRRLLATTPKTVKTRGQKDNRQIIAVMEIAKAATMMMMKMTARSLHQKSPKTAKGIASPFHVLT
jgi:hypothetical protein